MDCTNLYHNAGAYNVLTEVGIEVFPSAGHTHRVKGGLIPAEVTRLHALRADQQQVQSKTAEESRRTCQRPNCVFSEDNGSDY
jgi:hypothetical protein